MSEKDTPPTTADLPELSADLAALAKSFLERGLPPGLSAAQRHALVPLLCMACDALKTIEVVVEHGPDACESAFEVAAANLAGSLEYFDGCRHNALTRANAYLHTEAIGLVEAEKAHEHAEIIEAYMAITEAGGSEAAAEVAADAASAAAQKRARARKATEAFIVKVSAWSYDDHSGREDIVRAALRAFDLPTLAQIKPRRRPEFLQRLDELLGRTPEGVREIHQRPPGEGEHAP
jgi:hypothetical protein